MTQVTIPNRPHPGDNRDINAILANFDAITKVVNGELSSDNLENEAITLAKVEKGLFLELIVGGQHRKTKFVATQASKVGLDSVPSRSSLNDSFAHGMGIIPIFAVACGVGRVTVQEEAGTRSVVPSISINSFTLTEINYSATVPGTSNNGVNFCWLAIA